MRIFHGKQLGMAIRELVLYTKALDASRGKERENVVKGWERE